MILQKLTIFTMPL